jgi:hypothetical protein
VESGTGLQLPAGSYLVTAAATLVDTELVSPYSVVCSVVTSAGNVLARTTVTMAPIVETSTGGIVFSTTQVTMPLALQGVVSSSDPIGVNLTCDAERQVFPATASLSAIETGNLVNQAIAGLRRSDPCRLARVPGAGKRSLMPVGTDTGPDFPVESGCEVTSSHTYSDR